MIGTAVVLTPISNPILTEFTAAHNAKIIVDRLIVLEEEDDGCLLVLSTCPTKIPSLLLILLSLSVLLSLVTSQELISLIDFTFVVMIMVITDDLFVCVLCVCVCLCLFVLVDLLLFFVVVSIQKL